MLGRMELPAKRDVGQGKGLHSLRQIKSGAKTQDEWVLCGKCLGSSLNSGHSK